MKHNDKLYDKSNTQDWQIVKQLKARPPRGISTTTRGNSMILLIKQNCGNNKRKPGNIALNGINTVTISPRFYCFCSFFSLSVHVTVNKHLPSRARELQTNRFRVYTNFMNENYQNGFENRMIDFDLLRIWELSSSRWEWIWLNFNLNRNLF